VTPDAYCREIEAYLTRKNDGHLVRIVGPSFARVCGWAEQGVPLKIAFAGIDRYFERYYAKGPRRRPVHVDYCEADVLEMFDAWRRAVGVTRSASPSQGPHRTSRALESLPKQLERAMARLTALRAGAAPPISQDVLSEVVSELDRLSATAKHTRGRSRTALLERLAVLDRVLVEAARRSLTDDEVSRLKAQAEADLRPFEERMPREAWARAIDAALDRLVRDRAGLPILPVE
jgi:hypothetical protein